MKRQLQLYSFLTIATLLFSYNCIWSNENQIKNFDNTIYQAANQNWSVDASANGIIYFANHKGLLEFDGVSWKLHKLPNETILRSVLVVSDSLIYSSGYRELGYWKVSETGSLEYTSLNKLAESYFSKNDEFWKITKIGNEVYFQSFSKILIFRDNKIIPVEFPGFVSTMHQDSSGLLVAVSSVGIFRIENDEPKVMITAPELQNTIIRFLLPCNNGKLLIGTASNGIFSWNGTSLNKWNPELSDYFRENELNRAFITSHGKIIIGTIIDGILIFDENEQLKKKYNTSNGLQNNTVLGITTDIFGNIWLALDNGIDFISFEEDDGLSIETIPGIGSVYDAAEFENKLYLGTNRGLYFRELNNADGKYLLIPETQGQIWDLKIIDDFLVVGFNKGLLAIKNNKTTLISDQSGGFSITQDPFHENMFIESTYTNLINIEKNENGFSKSGTIRGFYDLIRYIEIDHRGNIWASHMHRGIYKLQLNATRDSVISTQYFGENSVFGKDHSIHIFSVENRIVFTTEEKLFTYDDINDTIIPFAFLNEKLGKYAAAQRIIAGPENNYWFITSESIGLFNILNDKVELLASIPRTLFTSNQMIDDFENVVPTGTKKAIICLENGIAYLNTGKTNKSSEIVKFSPSLREIILTDNQGNKGKVHFEDSVLQIKYRFNNLDVRYGFPHYTHKPIYFQARLKGLNPEWSKKTTNPVFTFPRLPEGKYELEVIAVDSWENKSLKNTIRIQVSPAWYLNNYARSGYILAIFLIIGGLQIWGVKRTRKIERQRLEKRERELIKLRNEKLQNEVEHKSKELANSTMALVKKNEFLLKLKETVTNQKEQLGTRYPDKYYEHLLRKIDNNISSHEDWHLFETNFEMAHEKFLHKIMEQFPNLTSKDLRLCAFLRMNLTSKEIAPLMGISVRGVENHRYRLRKKIGLDHDDSLIDMILKL